jgi:hypothetical protein
MHPCRRREDGDSLLVRRRPDEPLFIRLGCMLQVLCRKRERRWEDACHSCLMASRVRQRTAYRTMAEEETKEHCFVVLSRRQPVGMITAQLEGFMSTASLLVAFHRTLVTQGTFPAAG